MKSNNTDNQKSIGDEVDKRVAMVTGDPKRAIRKLSIPMIISMLLMMAYNLVDSIWVAGLGPNSLAALGFVTPVFMIVVGLGNGLGAGANSLISRCIGAKNKKGSDNAAIHSILLTLILSVVLTLFIQVFLRDILLAMGAGESLELAVQYGQIIFAGLIFLIFSSVASGILRAEGDVKRPMYAMAATAILNIVLDPIFIYYFGWGVSGAAAATVISAIISSTLIMYWLLLMSILGIVLNIMLVITGGTDAVAVYTAGWRVVMIAMIPAIGIGTAAITVAGAAYGSRKYANISTALNYCVKLAVGVACITGLIIYVFAPYIASIFAYSSASAFMAPSIAAFLQVMCLFLIVVPFGIAASSVFQGMGKGLTSLILTVIREVLFMSVFAYLLAFTLGIGEHGIWWGIVIGGAFGCGIAYIWAARYIKGLKRSYYRGNKSVYETLSGE